MPTAFGQATGGSAADSASPDVKAPTVNAVWVEREIPFTYMGIGTYYSCDGLRDKVEYVLEQLGARKDPEVNVSCFDHSGRVDVTTMARIKVAVPAEATPELLQQLASDQSKRELVGRVKGSSKDVDATTAQFPAERRVVQFNGQHGKRIEDGDCELLEQLQRQVLTPLGMREMPGSSLRCVPKQSQIGAVNLKLESLHPVKTGKEA